MGDRYHEQSASDSSPSVTSGASGSSGDSGASGGSVGSRSSGESTISEIEGNLRIQPLLGDRDGDEQRAKRQRRDREDLDTFPKRLLEILLSRKVLNSDDEVENYYRKTGDVERFDTFSCMGLEASGHADVPMMMRVREKLPGDAVMFKTPELEYFRLYRELLILGRILPPHPHIVRLRDILVSRKRIFIATERCPWADLTAYFPTATNTSAHRVFKQLCEAVQFMHRHGVVNNHLVPRSILFTEREHAQQIKIINFARAAYVPDMVYLLHNNFDPEDWLEPEEMRYASYHGIPGNDVNMLARILVAMVVGYWEPATPRLRTVRFDQEACDLVMMLGPPPFARRPGMQMTVDDILQHPWMVNGPRKL